MKLPNYGALRACFPVAAVDIRRDALLKGKNLLMLAVLTEDVKLAVRIREHEA